jgi:hypothetical protein
MRTLMLSLILATSLLGACGKKKAPAAPTNTATESAPAGGATDENEEKDMNAPEPGDESAGAKSSDPCEGGE